VAHGHSEASRDRSRPPPLASRPEVKRHRDDLLRLIFTSCHPVLSNEAQQVESTCVGPLALTLRLTGGLTTNEIARAFLVPEPAIAHRIVRAKRTLPDAHVP
jgi:predicted RNA polymerase sigma factor